MDVLQFVFFDSDLMSTGECITHQLIFLPANTKNTNSLFSRHFDRQVKDCTMVEGAWTIIIFVVVFLCGKQLLGGL